MRKTSKYRVQTVRMIGKFKSLTKKLKTLTKTYQYLKSTEQKLDNENTLRFVVYVVRWQIDPL